MVYKRIVKEHRLLKVNKTYQAESMMMKIRRMLANKEPINEEVETAFTNKKDGVLPAYDIRTDRWEIAQEAAGKMYEADLQEYLKSQKQADPKPAENESS